MRTTVSTIAMAIALFGAAQAEPCLPPTPAPDFANAMIRTTDLGHRTFLLEGASGTVGGNVAVVVGDAGTILRTTDGGHTWSLVPAPNGTEQKWWVCRVAVVQINRPR